MPDSSVSAQQGFGTQRTLTSTVYVGHSTQRDPIGLAGGINQYGYAGGDPVNHNDPFGLKITFIGATTQSAMRTLMRGSPTFRAMVVGLQRAPDNFEVRSPESFEEWSALRGTDFGQGATVKTGNGWAGLISPDASGDHLLRVVAHEVSHLAGVVPSYSGVAADCAKGDRQSTCADDQTARIWAEVQAYLDAQASAPSKSSRPDKDKQ